MEEYSIVEVKDKNNNKIIKIFKKIGIQKYDDKYPKLYHVDLETDLVVDYMNANNLSQDLGFTYDYPNRLVAKIKGTLDEALEKRKELKEKLNANISTT